MDIIHMKRAVIILATLIYFFFSPIPVIAQREMTAEIKPEETLEAVVTDIIDEKEIQVNGVDQTFQRLELTVTRGSLQDKQIIVENGDIPMSNSRTYRVNDQVIVLYSQDFEGNDTFFITDYVRRGGLLWLLVMFVILAMVIGRWQGATSLLGMVISFVVIFKFILPKILAGYDPVHISIVGSLVIIPVTFVLSHGANKKTGIAMIGTFISLIITGILANMFVTTTKLTGFASEEAGFLQALNPGQINIHGLLLAGIIIGSLGVLDDITVSQSSIVQKLKETDPILKANELYKKAMSVGKDHIASMVNTLILVYTGASIPLLLLFIDSPHPFMEVINYEIVAEEIVRTLVGSIGLMLAVPITTILAALTYEKIRT